MIRNSVLLIVAAMAVSTDALAAPVPLVTRDSMLQILGSDTVHDDARLILVQNRGQGGGQRAGGGNRGGNFNSNNFHKDVSGARNKNVNSNRNTNVNTNRNVNVNTNRSASGGCCYGNYDDGPNWGGVAAGVAVGAVVGAAVNSAASSPTYAAPPPTYPPGYVTPPPY